MFIKRLPELGKAFPRDAAPSSCPLGSIIITLMVCDVGSTVESSNAHIRSSKAWTQ